MAKRNPTPPRDGMTLSTQKLVRVCLIIVQRQALSAGRPWTAGSDVCVDRTITGALKLHVNTDKDTVSRVEELLNAPPRCRVWTAYVAVLQERSITGPASHFKAENIRSKQETTFITLTWRGSTTRVAYYSMIVNPLPDPSGVITAGYSGGSVTGLTPGQQYTFTIVSTIAADNIYPQMTTSVNYTASTGDAFKVANIAKGPTANSVTLAWTAQTYSLSVAYSMTVDPLPDPSGVITAGSSGGSVTGLTPGQQYTFAIVSTIAADNIYPQMTTSVNYTSSTAQLHGGPCDENIQCISRLTCLRDVCQCLSGQRLIDAACLSLNTFKVSVTASKTGTTSATLTWTAIDHGLPVTYSMTVDPPLSPPRPVTAGPQGGRVDGLTSGRQYTLTIYSTVPADSVYQETTTSAVYTVFTKQVYDGPCIGAIECDSGLSCRNGLCKCSPGQRIAEGSCILQRAHGEGCSQGTECLNMFSCLSGVCKCPSGERFTGESCQPENTFKVSITGSRRNTTSATLTWTAIDHGLPVTYSMTVEPPLSPPRPVTAGPQGGRVDGLTPGRQYTLIIYSTIPADSVYQETTVSGNISVWMIPAKPKGNGEEIKLSEGVFNFTFEGSTGQIKGYRVTIEGVFNSVFTFTPWISDVYLKPGTAYAYSIIAVNGNGDESEPLVDTFQVRGEKPGKVSSLVSTRQTNTSATVQWRTPKEPNGILIGYLVAYSMSGSSEECLTISCSNCDDQWPQNLQDSLCTRSSVSTIEKSQDFLNDPNSVIDLVIDSLQPFRSYTFIIQAGNKEGFGQTASLSTMTSVGAAKELLDVELMPTGSDTTAGLEVTWVPGEMTGPTVYEIRSERETSLGSGSYTQMSTVIVNGYNNTKFDINGLLAFWNYKVSMTAVTSSGRSQPKAKVVKTKSNVPGFVTGLFLELDPSDAQKFTLQFRCPVEQDRNGQLEKYVVRKMIQGSYAEDKYISHTPVCRFSTGNFGSKLEVGNNYTFQVKVHNTQYAGSFNIGKTSLIVPRAPKLLSSKKPLIQGPEQTQLTVQYISMKVCHTCLLDNIQGEVVSVGLLVCLRHDDTPCRAVPRSVAAAATYLQSELNGFLDPYLATPLDWHRTLNNLQHQQDYTFIIGNDKICSENPILHCNGPLPNRTDVIITAIACTVAGCGHYTYPRVYKTLVLMAIADGMVLMAIADDMVLMAIADDMVLMAIADDMVLMAIADDMVLMTIADDMVLMAIADGMVLMAIADDMVLMAIADYMVLMAIADDMVLMAIADDMVLMAIADDMIRNLEFVFYPGSPLDKESGESGGPVRNVPDGTEESTSGSTDGSAGLTWGVTGGIIASAVLVGAAVGAVIVVVVVWRNRKIAGRDSQVNNEPVVGSPRDTPGGVPQTSMPHDLVRNSPQPQHNASLRQQQDGHHQHSDYVDHYERVESPALETTLYEDPVNIFNRSVNQAQENQGLQRTPSISVTDNGNNPRYVNVQIN
ncbi:hypothetical protein RRG08_051761 [Elysia crispata]|uniref:Fibronectin type-III domain-containing protein n=1 Tax=Elysia crispata TaxID=231223 RepID=A0AAE1B6T2_9GAST|nr:hypothetical protein RRG08_051761 [Elysia crispata]